MVKPLTLETLEQLYEQLKQHDDAMEVVVVNGYPVFMTKQGAKEFRKLKKKEKKNAPKTR